jgi:hypothetical protein
MRQRQEERRSRTHETNRLIPESSNAFRGVTCDQHLTNVGARVRRLRIPGR